MPLHLLLAIDSKHKAGFRILPFAWHRLLKAEHLPPALRLMQASQSSSQGMHLTTASCGSNAGKLIRLRYLAALPAAPA